MPKEFKFVKYADAPRPADPERAKLDDQVDKIFNAPQLNSVLACGKTLHAFSLRSHHVEKSAKDLGTSVLACIHLPSLGSIFVSTTKCKVMSFDDTWFKQQREFLTEDPQLCFLAPKPYDLRRGAPTPVPTRLLSADTTGNLFEWDLAAPLSGLVQPLNERVVAKDWVTALLVPDGSLTVLVTASLDTSIKLWDRKTVWNADAVPMRVIESHSRPVTGLLDLPKLDMCLSFGQNQELYVWSPGTASLVMQRLDGHERPIANVFQGASWEELISVDRGGTVIVWDARFFNPLQEIEDPTIIEDDIVTDACYDPLHECILTTRKHIRAVTMNTRGRIDATQTGTSTQTGAVSEVGFCAHTLHFIVVAANEVTYWRASDGRAEAVITGLHGKIYPFAEQHVAGSLEKDEVTAMVICTENKPLEDGEGNADVIFASSGGEIAVHDTYEGRKLWTMPVFPGERLVFLEQIAHSGGVRLLCGTDEGRFAIFRNSQTVEGVGTKVIDYCWGMEERNIARAIYDEKLHLLAGMGVESSTIRVWELKPSGVSALRAPSCAQQGLASDRGWMRCMFVATHLIVGLILHYTQQVCLPLPAPFPSVLLTALVGPGQSARRCRRDPHG